MDDNKLGQAAKVVEDMNKDLELSKVEELIKDNCIPFDHNDKKYRVRLLNLKEKIELDELRRKYYGKLLKDKDILMEKDLILQYKERGINIEDINNQIKKLDAEDIDLQIKLGESISKNEGETILNTYKDQIETIRIKKQVLNAQKTLLLEFSLENQFLNYVSMTITYLSLDELRDEIWERMFSSIEEFQSYKDEGLINKAGTYSMLLQYV